MKGFNRVRLRERGSAARGIHAMGCMALLIVASWLTGSVGAMAQEPVRTEPVVVTATRIEEKVSEQASSVSVVTREDMEQKSPSLAGDVLQGIPGVDVQRTGSLGGLENIKIRGGKSTHTLVMIDGFPVNSPSSGEFDISALPVNGFERVEIVRGAQSALYGSNAMGGVVNFIPRKGEEGRQYGAGLSGGSFGTLQWSGFGQGPGREGNLHLGVSGLKSDGTLSNDDTDLFSFVGSGETSVGERNRLHLVTLSTDERRGIPIDDRGSDPVARRTTAGRSRRPPVGDDRFEGGTALRLRRRVRRVSQRVRATRSVPLRFFGFPGEDAQDPLPRRGEPLDEPRVHDIPGIRVCQGSGAERCRLPVSPFPDFVTDVSASTYNRSYFLQEELRFRKRTGVSAGGARGRQLRGGDEGQSQGGGLPPVRPGSARTASRLMGRGSVRHDRRRNRTLRAGTPTCRRKTETRIEAGADFAAGGDGRRTFPQRSSSGFPGIDQVDGRVTTAADSGSSATSGRRLLPRGGTGGDVVFHPVVGAGRFPTRIRIPGQRMPLRLYRPSRPGSWESPQQRGSRIPAVLGPCSRLRR